MGKPSSASTAVDACRTLIRLRSTMSFPWKCRRVLDVTSWGHAAPPRIEWLRCGSCGGTAAPLLSCPGPPPPALGGRCLAISALFTHYTSLPPFLLVPAACQQAPAPRAVSRQAICQASIQHASCSAVDSSPFQSSKHAVQVRPQASLRHDRILPHTAPPSTPLAPFTGSRQWCVRYWRSRHHVASATAVGANAPLLPSPQHEHA